MEHIATALARAFSITRPNEEAFEVASLGRFQSKPFNQVPSVSTADLVGNDDNGQKAERTMQARAALAGYAMYRLSDGAYILTKWNLSKTCPDLRSVGALLDRLGSTA